jgi:hypothetical protein
MWQDFLGVKTFNNYSNTLSVLFCSRFSFFTATQIWTFRFRAKAQSQQRPQRNENAVVVQSDAAAATLRLWDRQMAAQSVLIEWPARQRCPARGIPLGSPPRAGFSFREKWQRPISPRYYDVIRKLYNGTCCLLTNPKS